MKVGRWIPHPWQPGLRCRRSSSTRCATRAHWMRTGLRNIHPGWRKIVATLEARGWVAKSEQDDVYPAAAVQRESGPELTAAQAAAVAVLPDAGFSACLLEGVTGSGKTEVYLQLLEKQIAQGRQSMVLVPEIGLTPQLVERFRRRLPGTLAVMHSGLNETERAVAWLAARSGEADVIVGTRSAVFAPLARPGLLIVDEEHDSSFKQQDGFRYSARDIAVYRARQLDIPVLLGSATPAFESLNNAIEGRYLHATLPERPGNARQPEVRLIDLRQHAQRDGLSQPFIDAMRRHLEADGQALVYLNRRGFAPALLCVACGTTADCHRCDARMVVHQHSNRLICHHCGSERPAPASCADCGAELVPVGQGTERIEQALRKLFPEFKLARIDRDTTRRKGELARLLESVRSGESRILLGTQMLTKGHDFPDVSFVGIVDSDQGLFGTDFRSSERLAQSILQVAGRAGRAERAGEVWIQSCYPDHPLLRTLLANGYRHFADEALPERRAAGWPPFAHLALLRGECQARDVLFRFLGAAADSARTMREDDIQVLGPASSPMEKRAGRFHAQLLIRSASGRLCNGFLRRGKLNLAKLPEARKVRWSVDVDPVELF